VIADLGGLLLLNACILAAGTGVTCLAGWWRDARSLRWSVGVSYLVGLATYGVTAQLLFVLGAAMTRWEVIAVCAIPAFGSVAALGRGGSAELRWPARTRATTIAAAAVVAFLALLAVDLWFQPLWAFDSWTFWTPKAHALYALNGLDAGWFSQGDLANKDYPLLLPAVEAAGFRFTGYETSLLDLQSWLIFAAFLRAVYEIGAGRAKAVVLWATIAMLVVAPSVADQLAAAEADIPVAVLFAVAGMCAWVWLVERRPGALVLATVLAGGAAATKVEGFVFTVALFAALTLVAAAERRRRAAWPVAAGLAALGIGILPWRIWMSAHGIHNQASTGRLVDWSYLVHHATRIPLAIGYMVVKLADPRAWLLVIPFAAVLIFLALRTSARREAVFVILAVTLAFAGLVLAYWTTPFVFHHHLATSARRIITGIVFFAAALAPLLHRSEGGERPSSLAP